MLFESFALTINYRNAEWELDISERYGGEGLRSFEIVQGGIAICTLTQKEEDWVLTIADGLHPVVLEDTTEFVSNELRGILIQGIKSYYECFTATRLRS